MTGNRSTYSLYSQRFPKVIEEQGVILVNILLALITGTQTKAPSNVGLFFFLSPQIQRNMKIYRCA